MNVEKNDGFFVERSALTNYNFFDNHLSDIEYLRLTTRISVKCHIESQLEDRDDSYRINFYFKEAVLGEEYADDLLHILKASDVYTFSVVKSNPQTIRVTCYRKKREETKNK